MTDVIFIIQECLAGNGGAWKIFSAEFASIAQNIIRGSYELPSAERDDVIQNVFLKLIRGGLANFKGTTKYEFLKYFKTIVVNETKTYLASKRKDEKTTSLDATLRDNHETEQTEGLTLQHTVCAPNNSSRPDLITTDRDLLEKAMDVIKNDPVIDKQIFVMKVKGYKEEEIKDILKVPRGTVASTFSRMKAKIIKRLGER